jgi:hypothetical protein
MSIANLSDRLHGGITVDHERVGGITMRCKDLFLVLRKFDRSDLCWSLDRMNACAGGYIPDM